jgi:8-amino-7-oxononanoate synthase
MSLDKKKVTHTSDVRTFFSDHPNHVLADHYPLLSCRLAHRWFQLLNDSVADDVYTFQEVLQGKSGAEVKINSHPFYMMSSYDYLGLISHPEIELAAINAIKKYGTGTGGVRLLTGTNELHEELEKVISNLKGTESAVVFSSGYMANLAVITSLFSSKDIIITDEFVHKSIVDALKLAGITHQVFRHNDPDSLKCLLDKTKLTMRILIIVDAVYSMDGDICILPRIVELKEKYGALLMVDEAHSIGVLGNNGSGVNFHFNIDSSKIDIFSGSLSKAIPSNGGFIAAKKELILFLKHASSPFIFSAAPTPANTAAAIAAIEVMQKETWRLENLWKNTDRLLKNLKSLNLDTGKSESPVIPILFKKNEEALQLSKKLFDAGFIANAVVYPAVSVNRSRLRICCTAAHTPVIIDEFCYAMQKSIKD